MIHSVSSKGISLIVIGCILAVGAFMCVSTAFFANAANGGNSFPLDDPWIHLQFAKNLHDYGSFSYYKNEMVTSGSTSPLYTILLSLGFFFTSDEMLLSYAYGVVFFLLAGYYLFNLALRDFGENVIYAGAATLLLLMEPRLIWVSLSGMETTLFIFLLLAVLYYYRVRNSFLLGISSGFLLWTRPEAILFMILIALDFAYHEYIVHPEGGKKKPKLSMKESLLWAKKPVLIFLIFASLYVGFNLWLSGSLFPNTYAAKLKYYSGGGADYPAQVFHYFTDGHLGIFALFVVIGSIGFVMKGFNRQPIVLFIPFLFSVEMFFVYWKNLPYLYQEGRYLMPVLPFLLLLGIGGVEVVLSFARTRIKQLLRPKYSLAVALVIMLPFIVQFGIAGWNKRTEYAEYCKYISDRQVRTALWIGDHLPMDARIATHDVGAIAYYSGRRIVDMVGLISPEMIQRIGNINGLIQFMNQEKVTHLAVLRNWFEVDNVNPLYQTDVQRPEIMEVFSYNSRNIHFVMRDVGQLLEAGQYYCSINDVKTGGRLLEQAVQRDPQSSRAHLLLGSALLAAGKIDNAGAEFETSLKLHPLNWDARMGEAEIALRKNNSADAIRRLESIIAEYPQYANAYRMLSEISRTIQHDSLKAITFMQQAEELERQRNQ